ncbi:MAG: GNAT family N-acetyltransferase [Bacteroidetes bacterium]|nr:GNAT family N-acetyltransferase [Bacteroidota bacterium]
MNSCSIRSGTQSDLPSVLNLIKELAEYEKAPHEVTNTLQLMEEDAFGEKPAFDFFVAEVDGKVVGMAIYYIKYSTWKGKCVFLEDLIITEKMRCKGIGEKLFFAVAGVAKKMKVQRMEWQVLDWNEPAINFYKKHQANLDSEWINGKLVFEQLQKIVPPSSLTGKN